MNVIYTNQLKGWVPKEPLQGQLSDSCLINRLYLSEFEPRCHDLINGTVNCKLREILAKDCIFTMRLQLFKRNVLINSKDSVATLRLSNTPTVN